MKALTRKNISIILIFVLIIAILSGYMFIKLNNEKSHWKSIVAEHNYNHWNEIHFTALQIENRGFAKDAVKEHYLFINAKIYSNTDSLYPIFSGSSKYTAFLRTYYISLAQDIPNMQDDKLQEALDLFKDATIELKNLSGKILKMAEDANERISLIETNSELYNKAEKMIREYCNEYGDKISKFNLSLSNA